MSSFVREHMKARSLVASLLEEIDRASDLGVGDIASACLLELVRFTVSRADDFDQGLGALEQILGGFRDRKVEVEESLKPVWIH